MRKSISMVLLQTLFWGGLVYAAGTVVYKVGKHLNNLTSVLAHGGEKK